MDTFCKLLEASLITNPRLTRQNSVEMPKPDTIYKSHNFGEPRKSAAAVVDVGNSANIQMQLCVDPICPIYVFYSRAHMDVLLCRRFICRAVYSDALLGGNCSRELPFVGSIVSPVVLTDITSCGVHLTHFKLQSA